MLKPFLYNTKQWKRAIQIHITKEIGYLKSPVEERTINIGTKNGGLDSKNIQELKEKQDFKTTQKSSAKSYPQHPRFLSWWLQFPIWLATVAAAAAAASKHWSFWYEY